MLRMGRSARPETSEPEPARASNQPINQPAPAPLSSANTDAPAQSRPSTPSAVNPAANSAPPRAIGETEALARGIKEGQVGGFVGVHSIVSGETNFKGMLRVDGRVAGQISSQDGTLIVSAGGQVDANIEVAVAKINGTVNGDIKARERIEFGRTARVNGNIQTPALIIEQGAIFEGSCRMSAQEVKPAREQAQPRAAQPPARHNQTTPAPANRENRQVPPAVARATAPGAADASAVQS